MTPPGIVRYRLALLRLAVAGLSWLLLLPMLAAQSGMPAPAPTADLPAETRAIVESERFRRLATELRCLVCQNQSLADSNAPLAQDLRNEVVRLMASGRDDRAIKDYLVDRYGEFVLYLPPVSGRNLMLWAGPFLLLAIGVIAWWRLGRRRAATDATADRSASARAALDRVDDLLGR